jgi:hypothetical protein
MKVRGLGLAAVALAGGSLAALAVPGAGPSKEASTMALYVAICLLAGFAALPRRAPTLMPWNHLGGHHRAGRRALVRVPRVGTPGGRRKHPSQ